ncbi:MAG: sulfite exporter TauE/SafE family protein [Candidatus Asgardarchaeum sp.]
MLIIVKIIFLIFIGLFVGFIGGLVGLGGGFLFVPIFYFVLGLDIKQCIGTSLFIIPFLSISAAYSHFKKRLIDFKTALIFEISTIPGAVAGAYLTIIIPNYFLKVLFGVILSLGAYKLLKKKEKENPINKWDESSICSNNHKTPNRLNMKRQIVTSDGTIFTYDINILKLLFLGIIAGLVSGVAGVGGGIIKVPALILLLGVPPHVAIATSSFMIVFTATSAALTHFLIGNVVVDAAEYCIIGALIGAQLGSKTAHRVDQRKLRTIIGIILLIVSVRFILENVIYIIVP